MTTSADRQGEIHGLEPFYNARLLEGQDVIGATVDFFRRPHHAIMVKVEQKDDVWEATNDPERYLEDIYHVYDTALCPVELPGLDGHWMLLVHPYGD